VVLSNELNLSDMARVLRAGAVGYLVSELSCEAFSLSLLLVMNGEKVLPGSLADVLAANDRELSTRKIFDERSNLTDRERQILQCLLSGYSNKLIARVLNITEGTVKVHLKALMKKISAVNRTQAALWARSHGISQDSKVPVSQRTLLPPSRNEQAMTPLIVGKNSIGQSSQTNGQSHPTLHLSAAECDDCHSATQHDGSLHRVGRKGALGIDRCTRSD
jgi:DNA-binding CsgD family transcriptional regulator